MSAAVLQGVPYTTLDTDVWIDLPPRQYIRVLNLCRELGAQIVANTVVILEDGITVNFLYRMDGIRTFRTEYRDALKVKWLGKTVRVLPVEQILRRKRAVGRPKDLAHVPILKLYLACQKPRRGRSRPASGKTALEPKPASTRSRNLERP